MGKYFWWLGVWEIKPTGQSLRPASGLIYWITAPDNFRSLRFVVYTLFILLSGAISSWVAILDKEKLENPDKLAEDLLYANGVTMDLKKRSNKKEDSEYGDPDQVDSEKGDSEEKDLDETGDSDVLLKEEVKRLVPMAAIIGGLVLGFVCILSDIYGVIGGAQGMLVATNIMYAHYEAWEKESKRK